MRAMFYAAAAALAISPVIAAPAWSQTAPAQQPSAKPAADPNEVVCEKEQDTGSRLATHRECKTRAQWAEERRLNRQDIDKIQMQRPCNDTSC